MIKRGDMTKDVDHVENGDLCADFISFRKRNRYVMSSNGVDFHSVESKEWVAG